MSAGEADAAAAMAVDSRQGGSGDVLGPEEEIDATLANLLLASWPVPAVVDDQFRRFPWEPPGHSLVEQRYATIESRRMTIVWTNIRAFYGSLYAVPERTVTDFPFLRRKEDWQVCQVLSHLANRELPPEVVNAPYYSWDYHPGSPPKFGVTDPGFYVPVVLRKWACRNDKGPLALYEQRELRDISVARRQVLYPATPAWWASVEVLRGMAARLPHMVGLQGSQLMGETLEGPYHCMLATLWAVEVADVFVGSIRHHGHLWRLPVALREAFAVLTAERLCSADSTVQPLLEAGPVLLRRVEEQADAAWMEWEGTPRGVFRCAKAVDDEGFLTLSEGLWDPRLPYGRDILPYLRLRTLDRELAESGPSRYGPAAALAAASAPPSSAHATTASAALSTRPPPAQAAAASRFMPPMCGGVGRPPYTARGGARNTRARRAYPLVESNLVPRIGGQSGPLVGPMPLFTWEGSAQLGISRPVGPAVWSGLGLSLGDLPPILNNGVDHTLIMALSRAYVRLRNEMISVASRPVRNREAIWLCTLGTAESLRRILAEEYGVAVTETNTVLAGWSIRHMGAAVPTAGPISPATNQRPPSPAPPHYGAGSGVAATPPYGVGSGSSLAPSYGAGSGASAAFPFGVGSGSSPAPSYGAGSGAPAMPLYRAKTGPSANPPCPSGPDYYAPAGGPGQGDGHGYAPEGGPSQGDGHGYAPCSRGY